jgi:dienelactone hydrolase
MRKSLIIIIFILLVIIFVQSFYIIQDKLIVKNTEAKKDEIIEKPLMSYTFENLKKTKLPTSEITFGGVVEDTDDYTRRLFYFATPENPTSTQMNKVSGLATIPKRDGTFPVIIMLRGFVPEESFTSGAGTNPSAGEISKKGYITLAPDFLGFGESDKGSDDSFENRFQTYTTTLSLLNSIENLNKGLETEYVGTISADLNKIGLWGHSNGGHIALSVLAITGRSFPTALWAPVSKSFPYSILFYTDETDDQGKALRTALGEFEKLYDARDFSPERYYKWINAPVEINQGTADEEIPYWWSDELVKTLEESESAEVTYNKYPGANHNLQPTWNETVTNTINFYNLQFETN